jgi:hypothetical protein
LQNNHEPKAIVSRECNPELDLQNSIQGTPAISTTAAVSAFHHSFPNPTFSNNFNVGDFSSGSASSEVARHEHFHVQSRTKEKRWVICYEELILFQQV